MVDSADIPEVTLSVEENGRQVFSMKMHGKLTIGRQEQAESGPFGLAQSDSQKLVIARLNENEISRRQLEIELIDGDTLMVRNLSDVRPVKLGYRTLQCLHSETTKLPVELRLTNGILIRIDNLGGPTQDLQSLVRQTLAPGTITDDSSLVDLLESSTRGIDNEDLVRWLRRITSVFMDAASSHEFFIEAAHAAATIVRLDSAASMAWTGTEWEVKALHVAGDPSSVGIYEPSHNVLDRIKAEKCTFYSSTSGMDQAEDFASLMDVTAVVAAPVLNRDNEVIGALYGERHGGLGSDGRTEISELEATLVDMLASGLAAGIARLEQEQRAFAFEQHFSPNLAQRLQKDPGLLEGMEADVTVLFCDIRNFSRISHRIGPRATVQWISGVMDVLSQCVIDNDGVLVDYIGDELMAMWGAPDSIPNHGALACRAGLQMIDKLSEVNERWQSIINADTDIGIGINSGVAHVGNTGSKRKFKYGPLGNAVNLASRVQGVTKQIKSQLLVTGQTVEQLKDQFATRQLCQVKLVNIDEAVKLYELVDSPQATWQKLKREYETALEAFSKQEFRRAIAILGNILEEHPDDGPAVYLLLRSVNEMVNGASPEHPTWVLEAK